MFLAGRKPIGLIDHLFDMQGPTSNFSGWPGTDLPEKQT